MRKKLNGYIKWFFVILAVTSAAAGDILTFLSEDGTTIHLISNLDASADNN